MKLTDLEYGVIMQAIELAKDSISEGNFIDPYNNEEGITDTMAFEALIKAELKLITNHLR